jgi:hypothetical protein
MTTLKKAVFKYLYCLVVFSLLAGLFLSPISAVSASAETCTHGFQYNLSVDSANIEICLPFIADFSVSPANDELIQSASITRQTPFQQFLIYAVPYGLKIGSSVMDVAEPGISDSYLENIRALFVSESDQVFSTPPISIFNLSVPGLARVMQDATSGQAVTNQINVAWVLEAGDRLWILQFIEQGDFSSPEKLGQVLEYIQTIRATGSDFDVPSISSEIASQAAPPDFNPVPPLRTLTDLPFPTWWSGDCNVNNHPGSYPLGGAYRGLKACGPLNTLVLVNFGVDNRQYE